MVDSLCLWYEGDFAYATIVKELVFSFDSDIPVFGELFVVNPRPVGEVTFKLSPISSSGDSNVFTFVLRRDVIGGESLSAFRSRVNREFSKLVVRVVGG